MRFVTRTVGMMAAAGLALALAACGGDDAPDEATTPSFGAGPTGTAVTIEPLDELEGATETTFAGVTLLVPEGYTQDRSTGSSGVEQLTLRAEGEDRAPVILTVTTEEGVTDGAVDGSALTAETQLGATGEWTDLARVPARWDGLPYAVAITGTLGLPDGTERDAILVTTRDEDGTRIVGISAEAPTGELEDSVAYDVLRTMRVDG